MSGTDPLRHKPSRPPPGHVPSDDGSGWEKKEWRVPEPGTVVADRYEVLGLLGEGGMGVVVEAEHLELGIRVALKLLDPVYSHDPDYAERFKREARTASRLGHQNIVKVLDLGVAEDGRLYYSMELVKGEHLGDVIEREGALEPERAARIVLQICDALRAAHERNVIHRDLKPENVMVARRPDGSDFVRLTDFGIAIQLDGGGDRLTKTGGVLGTPHYMAPEQVARGAVDARTDVYSAGVVLYELLTGTPPFHEGVPVEIMTDQLRTVPESPRRRAPELGVPALLDGVVMRALEKKPKRRQQSMEELALELWAALEVLGPQSALARPLGVAARGQRVSHDTVPEGTSPLAAWLGRRGRQKKLLWALGTAVVLLAGTTAGAIVGSRRLARTISNHPQDRPAAAGPRGPAVATVGRTAVRDAGVVPAGEDAAAAGVDGGEGALALLVVDGGGGPSADEPSAVGVGDRTTPPRPPGGGGPSATPRRAPSSAAAHARLGQAEFQRGNNVAAARHFERAVQLRPASTRYRILYGGVLVRLGRRGEARSQYEAVLRRDPDNAVARRMLDRL